MTQDLKSGGNGDPGELLDFDKLARGSSRSPDYAAENRALVELASALTESGKSHWEKIARTVLNLCAADSAVISLIAEPDQVRWQAVAGAWSEHFREWHSLRESPTSVVLSDRGPLLLRAPERSFAVFKTMSPAATEALLAPIVADGKVVGGLWVVAHRRERHFDREEARVLDTIARFASVAYVLSQRSGTAEWLRAERLAALNLMEDAIAARRQIESVSAALKLSEERLRQDDHRKNHFLAMLGHELRNPLAAIRGGVALLRSEKASPKTRAATLPVVAEQVSHMERLVEDLLDIARIVQGQLQVRKECIMLQTSLMRAIEMIQIRADAEGFKLNLQIQSEPLPVFADPARLTQVFANLLTNALKYSGEARQIDITAGRNDGSARVAIRDYGPGIAPELLARIFEPFVQAEPTPTLDGGLGLGLAVVRQLISLHEGSVDVRSGGDLKGSEFIICLPLAKEAT